MSDDGTKLTPSTTKLMVAGSTLYVGKHKTKGKCQAL